MSVGRACVCLAVVLLNFHTISGKPFFFSNRFWCDMLCDDYDDDDNPVSTMSTTTDFDDVFDVCADCPTTTRRPPRRNQQMPPINFTIPPNGQGMSMTMSNVGGTWFMNMVPWGGPPGAAPATPAPGATPAPATTAAPRAATTAAGGTTAAGTTAAPTTKAG